MKYILDMDKYAALARRAAAEGCVLLENRSETLPVRKGSKVAVFGRSAFNYYKSGTGSGGLVNTRYVVSILDALKEAEEITLNRKLLQYYEDWIGEHPFEKGAGWGQEPWSQQEMPLSAELVKTAAEGSDLAVVIIGRTAGEDQDTLAEPGSFYLTEAEEDMLAKVCANFDKTAVLLNVGNIIDMKWVEKYQPSAVMYVWQGGQEGGNGAVDVLLGRTSPSGKLTDTIAKDISDYPSTKNFGDPVRNIYQEDIYVGYRYFETFARDRVLYPFGYGLSYTSFSICTDNFCEDEGQISLTVAVTNAGNYPGREVVQIYGSAPQGRLGKPARELKAYRKTEVLAPGEEKKISFVMNKKDFASYDDGGATGHKACYVLEAGEYQLFAGTDVRSAKLAGAFTVSETAVTEELEEALAPVIAFERMKPQRENASKEEYRESFEPVPLRTVEPMARRKERLPKEAAFTGNRGYQLSDVYYGKITMEEFTAQLNEEELASIVRGEGMCSAKVTPGTASAFGGVTEALKAYGIPIGCCSDGPSGIRMDCGTHAFSLPNGTLLGCTFNVELAEQLYRMEGIELRYQKIDTLLGPGMNIHRNPLNGRNFEYISEDPYLTGTIAAAQLKGLNSVGVTGTIKHFAANNQELHRHDVDSVISERALREIYLKGFEIAVREGRARSIMTTYSSLNGIWTAGNYDLVTTVLREEWGFKGIVMTDWWAKINEEGQEAAKENTGVMVRAQNDLYMVVADSATNSMGDNSIEALKTGIVTREEFVRCAGNICGILMELPTMERFLGITDNTVEIVGLAEDEIDQNVHYTFYEIAEGATVDMSHLCTDGGTDQYFGIHAAENGSYEMTARMRADSTDLAQMAVSVFCDNQIKGTYMLNGAEREWVEQTVDLNDVYGNHYIKLHFSMSGLEIESITFHKKS